MVFSVPEFLIKQITNFNRKLKTVVPTTKYKTGANPPLSVAAVYAIVTARVVTSLGLIACVFFRGCQA